MGITCHNPANSTQVIFQSPSIGLAVFPFILELTAVLVAVVVILNKYTSVRKQPVHYYLSIIVGWYLALAILVLMPADISMAWYEGCICNQFLTSNTTDMALCSHLKPWNYVDSDILAYIFTTFYWIIFFGCWVVYPIMQSMVASAEFTFLGKCKATLRENAIFYGVAGVFGIIGVLILFFTTANRQFGKTVGLAMTLANNWGTFLLVCLLGVGIVEVPRAYWRRSNVDLQLRYYEYMVGQMYDSYKKSHEELHTVLRIIRSWDSDLRQNDPYRKYLDEMLKTVPPDYALATRGDYEGDMNYSNLVDLNARLIQALHDYNAGKTLFHRNVEKAFAIQDIVRMRDREIKYHIPWTLKKVSFWNKNPNIGRAVSFIEWVYWRYTVQWLWKVACAVCCIFTAVLIWNEETMFTAFLNVHGMPNFSIYYLLIFKVPHITPFFIQVICFIAIGYNTWCTYDSLMNIRLFNWYKLLPHQQTDTYSLLFSAAYLCRISVPVALNFVYLTGFDHSQSAFVRVMGNMVVVPFFGGMFNIIFPALIILVALATFFDLWNRIFYLFTCGRWKSFEYDEFSEDEYSSSGRELLAKEREAEVKGTGVEYFGERVIRHGFIGVGAGIDHGATVDLENSGTRDTNMVPLDDIVGPTPSRTGVSDRLKKYLGSGSNSPSPLSSSPSTFGASEAAARHLWEVSTDPKGKF